MSFARSVTDSLKTEKNKAVSASSRDCLIVRCRKYQYQDYCPTGNSSSRAIENNAGKKVRKLTD